MFSTSRWYKEDIEYIQNSYLDWDKLKNKSILVTGATGLIGTVLIDALMARNETHRQGMRVVVLVRNTQKVKDHFGGYISHPLFEYIVGDITQEIVIHEKIDFIINLASNTHPHLYSTEPIKTIDTIVKGTENILKLAASQGVYRTLNASSVEIYGENRGDTERFTEDYSGYINCNTVRAGYTEGKRLGESLCQAYLVEKDVDVISLRLGRVYGSSIQDTDTKSTSQFIHKAVKGEDVILKSEGMQQYSYVYVADAVLAFLVLLTNGKAGEAYNVSDDEVKTFKDTAEILAEIGGSKVIFELPNKFESRGYSTTQKALMDSSKIRDLGWSAKYHLEDGLRRTVEIIRSRNETVAQ